MRAPGPGLPRRCGRRLCALLLVVLLAMPAAAGTFRRPGKAERLTREQNADSLKAEPERLPAPPPGGTERDITPAGAFLRSVAMPGWGQAALARSNPELKGRGRGGFWLDLGLVAGAWGLSRYSRIKESEYQAYARRNAGAGDHGDGSNYWVDVSNYSSRAEFNQAMLEVGQPRRRYLDSADDWNWSSEGALIRYRDLRAVSERAASQALAASGAMFINHVLSGVQALRLARQLDELTCYPVDGGLGLALRLDLSTPRRAR